MNPIINKLNRTNPLQILMSLKSNPQNAFLMLMNSNPQFKAFYESNKDKSPEQIANEYGIDIRQVYELMK